MKIVGEMKSNNKRKKHAFLLEKHYFCRYEKILTCISDAYMLWFICDGTATERRWEDPPKRWDLYLVAVVRKVLQP